MISETTQAHIISEGSARIVEIVGEHVSLTNKGSEYIGLCPFHQEKTGSFTVNAAKGVYHCFGCGAGGDVVTFIRAIESCTFVEALRSLASRLNVPIEEHDGQTETEKKQSAEKRLMISVMSRAVDFYHSQIGSPLGGAARLYMENRGVATETIDKYRIGYAASGWNSLVKHLRGDLATAEKLGLVAKNDRGYYDAMRDRIVFPIFTINGVAIGIAGRTLIDAKPKYLNSPESPLYSKSDTLFGLNIAADQIHSSSEAIIVEGYMDQINLHILGVRNAVATCGTALTQRQVRRVISAGAKQIHLMFDGDTAGREAIKKGIVIVRGEMNSVFVRSLPAGVDPGDIKDIEQLPSKMIAEEYLYRMTPEGEHVMARLAEYDKLIGMSKNGQKDPAKALALRMLFG